MAIRFWPQLPTRRWRARILNILATRSLALTLRAYAAGVLGPSATKAGRFLASTVNRTALRLLRRRRDNDRPARGGTFDLQSRHVLKRFLLKLTIRSLAALAQARAPWGLATAAKLLATFSALICAALALLKDERPIAETLNYWDEAIAFLAIGLAAWPSGSRDHRASARKRQSYR
jgi:hypothetical protein